jgi:transcriptional regulator with GAF, ATPase, and Fis domain
MLFLGAESLAGAAVTNGRLSVIQDRHASSQLLAAHWVGEEQSAVACPILRKTRVAGCLLLSSVRPHAFSDTHLSLIERYTNLIAIVFDSAHFFEITNIHLRLMTDYQLQAPYTRQIGLRITQQMGKAAATRQYLTFQQAQEKVWQEMEEELLQLPPYAGT